MPTMLVVEGHYWAVRVLNDVCGDTIERDTQYGWRSAPERGNSRRIVNGKLKCFKDAVRVLGKEDAGKQRGCAWRRGSRRGRVPVTYRWEPVISGSDYLFLRE